MLPKLKLGVAGLGRAFAVMLPTLARDPRVALVGAADPRAEARAQFEADFQCRVYREVAELCADPNVDAVYVATPHQFHAEHAIARKAGVSGADLASQGRRPVHWDCRSEHHA